MLHEISSLRQSDHSLVKRWFSSSQMDLFIWYHRKVPVKFQLSYNMNLDERAISWDFHHGFRYYKVDSGETHPSKYKKTPILHGICSQKNLSAVARGFLAISSHIDAGVSDFIYAYLMAYPALPLPCGAAHTDHPVVR